MNSWLCVNVVVVLKMPSALQRNTAVIYRYMVGGGVRACIILPIVVPSCLHHVIRVQRLLSPCRLSLHCAMNVVRLYLLSHLCV